MHPTDNMENSTEEINESQQQTATKATNTPNPKMSALQSKVASEGIAMAANAVAPGSGVIVKKVLKSPAGQNALNQVANPKMSALKNKVASEGVAMAANAVAPGSGAIVKKLLKTPAGQNALNQIASPKRANSLVPGAMLGLPKSKPTEAKENLTDSESEALENELENDGGNKGTDLKGNVSKKILDFIIKHPHVAIAIGGFLTSLIISFVILMILACFMGSDAKASGGNSSGSTNSGHVNNATSTEICSQLSGKSLSDALSEHNTTIDDFNNNIKSKIESAGLKTREGVVAAALSITSDLCEEYKIRLPYEWGGGHDSKISLASGQWGSKLASPVYANDRSYEYSGLDCSGFVSWAIYNAGYDFPIESSDSFSNYGTLHSMNSSFIAKPGDLIFHPGHIMMIVGVDEGTKLYKVAEAAGADEGMRVRTMSFDNDSNQIIDMTNYYSRGGA